MPVVKTGQIELKMHRMKRQKDKNKTTSSISSHLPLCDNPLTTTFPKGVIYPVVDQRLIVTAETQVMWRHRQYVIAPLIQMQDPGSL